MDQREQFQIATVHCNLVSHQQEEIKGLGLKEQCENPSANCYMCSQELHQSCHGSIKMLKNIPQIVQPLQLVVSKLNELKITINLKMSKLIKLIDDALIPISQYSENPNLGNLNILGTLLKSKIELIIMKQVENVGSNIDSLFKKCNNDIFKEIFRGIDYEALEVEMQELCDKNKAGDFFKIVEAALQNNQNDKKLLFMKGHTLNRLSRYQEAIDCCDKAIKIDLNFAKPWNVQGNALSNLNKIQESIICYDQAINIDPNYFNPWMNKGLALNRLLKNQDAIECFNQALIIKPSNMIALNKKGSALNGLQRYQEAIGCFNQVLNIDPYNCYALNEKGSALNGLQRYEESIECFNQSLSIDPNNQFAIGQLKLIKKKLLI